MGALGLSPARFAVFNLIGAALWAPLVTGVGYGFGRLVQRLFGDVGPIDEVVLLCSVFVLGVVVAIVGWVRSRRP
jgi:membrane protein DedA with SNARE-associated domain